MDWLNSPLDFVIQTLLAELIVVVAGVLVAHSFLALAIKLRYGRWQVRIIKENTEILRRDISPTKAKEILGEPADMSVFLKGVVSPYGWINCDLLREGKEIGLFVQDNRQRLLTINLDKNPDNANRIGERG